MYQPLESRLGLAPIERPTHSDALRGYALNKSTAAHSNRTTSLRFPYYFSFTFLLSKSLAHSFSLSSHCRFRLSLYDSTARSLLADSHCILSFIYRYYLRIILIRIVRYRYPNNGKNSVYRYCELYVFFHVFTLVIYPV